MRKPTVLVTGATGHVGRAVVISLERRGATFRAGKRRVSTDQDVRLDLEDPSTFKGALEGVDALFLMRPPALTDAKGIFRPFLEKAKQLGVKHIVFLSLLGADKIPVLPHRKVEKEILRCGIPYTFLRPGFFMQNLESVHAPDIRELDQLYIPMDDKSLNLIDARDIGEVAARVLTETGHENRAYPLTGPGVYTMNEVGEILSTVLGREITYPAPSLLSYRKRLIARGEGQGFATVSTILYLTSRWGVGQGEDPTLERILGRPPMTLEIYVRDRRHLFDPRESNFR